MKLTLTQVRSCDLIAYAEARGWVVKLFESRGTTFFKKIPQFTLVLRREVEDPFFTLHSLTLFIGSGRVSGTYSVFGFRTDSKYKIGNWNDAKFWALHGGIPTEEDKRRQAVFFKRPEPSSEG